MRPTKFKSKQTHTIQVPLVLRPLQGLPPRSHRGCQRTDARAPSSAPAASSINHRTEWLRRVLPDEAPGTPVWSIGRLEPCKLTDQQPLKLGCCLWSGLLPIAEPLSDPRTRPVVGRSCHTGTGAWSWGTYVDCVLIPTRGSIEFSPGE